MYLAFILIYLYKKHAADCKWPFERKPPVDLHEGDWDYYKDSSLT